MAIYMECAEHKKTAEYFCSSHSRPICANCAVFDHEDCDVNDLHIYEHQTHLIDDVSSNIRRLTILDKATSEQIRRKKFRRAAKPSDVEESDAAVRYLEFLEHSHEWYQDLIEEATSLLQDMQTKKGCQSVESKASEDLLTNVNEKLMLCLDKNVREGTEKEFAPVELLFHSS